MTIEKRLHKIDDNSVCLVKRELMQPMKERESQKTLTHREGMADNYYIGAGQPRKISRGLAGKTPFIKAEETDIDSRPTSIALQAIKGFTDKKVVGFARAQRECSCDVSSDELACFGAVISQSYSHINIVKYVVRRSTKKTFFKWVNRSYGYVKSALIGTCRQQTSKNVLRYFAEFHYRFSCCHVLAGILARLAWVSPLTSPMPFRLISLAESQA